MRRGTFVSGSKIRFKTKCFYCQRPLLIKAVHTHSGLPTCNDCREDPQIEERVLSGFHRRNEKPIESDYYDKIKELQKGD